MKEGDTVVCIAESRDGFFGKEGEEYTLREDATSTGICLVEDPTSRSISADRFRVVRKANFLPSFKEMAEEKGWSVSTSNNSITVHFPSGKGLVTLAWNENQTRSYHFYKRNESTPADLALALMVIDELIGEENGT